jgi:hypothetical protein
MSFDIAGSSSVGKMCARPVSLSRTARKFMLRNASPPLNVVTHRSRHAGGSGERYRPHAGRVPNAKNQHVLPTPLSFDLLSSSRSGESSRSGHVPLRTITRVHSSERITATVCRGHLNKARERFAKVHAPRSGGGKMRARIAFLSPVRAYRSGEPPA